MTDSSEYKKFFDEQKKTVSTLLSNPYTVWIIFIVLLAGLLIMWLSINNISLSNRYVQFGDACSGAQGVAREIESKLMNELVGLDASAKNSVANALNKVKNNLSVCNNLILPQAQPQAQPQPQPQPQQAQPQQAQPQAQPQQKGKVEHFRQSIIDDSYCPYDV